MDLEKAYLQGRFDAVPYINGFENLAEAANRAAAKEPYSNPSSTVHRLTNEILKNAREQ